MYNQCKFLKYNKSKRPNIKACETPGCTVNAKSYSNNIKVIEKY